MSSTFNSACSIHSVTKQLESGLFSSQYPSSHCTGNMENIGKGNVPSTCSIGWEELTWSTVNTTSHAKSTCTRTQHHFKPVDLLEKGLHACSCKPYHSNSMVRLSIWKSCHCHIAVSNRLHFENIPSFCAIGRSTQKTVSETILGTKNTSGIEFRLTSLPICQMLQKPLEVVQILALVLSQSSRL